MALMVPGSRMPMDRDDNAENADQAAAPPVEESLEPTDTGEDLDAKADTPQDIEEGAARQPFSPIGSRHRTTSQLAVKPPNGLRGRVVVYPEVLGDRPERPTAPTHLSRLGGDALEHRDGRRIPQLDLERHRSQGSQSLRACRRPDRTRPRDQQVRPLGSRRGGRAIKIRGSPGQSPRHRSMMIAKSLSAMPGIHTNADQVARIRVVGHPVSPRAAPAALRVPHRRSLPMNALTLKELYESQLQEELKCPPTPDFNRREVFHMLRVSGQMTAGALWGHDHARTWVWSDIHLGHTKTIEAFGRPFGTVDEMNDKIFRNWEQVVASADTILILGDVTVHGLWGQRCASTRILAVWPEFVCLGAGQNSCVSVCGNRLGCGRRGGRDGRHRGRSRGRRRREPERRGRPVLDPRGSDPGAGEPFAGAGASVTESDVGAGRHRERGRVRGVRRPRWGRAVVHDVVVSPAGRDGERDRRLRDAGDGEGGCGHAPSDGDRPGWLERGAVAHGHGGHARKDCEPSRRYRWRSSFGIRPRPRCTSASPLRQHRWTPMAPVSCSWRGISRSTPTPSRRPLPGFTWGVWSLELVLGLLSHRVRPTGGGPQVACGVVAAAVPGMAPGGPRGDALRIWPPRPSCWEEPGDLVA